MLSSVFNFRDVGGYKNMEGKEIRKGLLFRSGQLSNLSDSDIHILKKIEIKNCIDLRSEQELKKYPQKIPENIKYHIFDVLSDAKDSINPIVLEKMIRSPREANEIFEKEKVEDFFIKAYREIITMNSARKSFSNFFSLISNRDELPALFHCTTGKDRTGWVSACFLKLMDVPEETIYKDYLLSNEYILPAYKKEIDYFLNNGGDISIIESILGVKQEYLDAAFDEMEKIYGKIEDYFHIALGIDYQKQEKIKKIFLH